MVQGAFLAFLMVLIFVVIVIWASETYLNNPENKKSKETMAKTKDQTPN